MRNEGRHFRASDFLFSYNALLFVVVVVALLATELALGRVAMLVSSRNSPPTRRSVILDSWGGRFNSWGVGTCRMSGTRGNARKCAEMCGMRGTVVVWSFHENWNVLAF